VYTFLDDRIKRAIEKIQPYIYTEEFKIKEFDVAKGVKWYKDIENVKEWNKYSSEQIWGGINENYCFAFEFAIPENFDGKSVIAMVSIGRDGKRNARNPQFLAYVNGKLMQGLDTNHTVFNISKDAKAGEKFHVILIAWTGMIKGELMLDVSIGKLNEDVKQLYYDLKTPYDVLLTLEKDSKDSVDILEHLNNAVNLLDFRSFGSKQFYDSVSEAIAYLTEEFYKKYCGRDNHIEVCALGHTHIDVAWLWTLTNTEQKTVRSFSTALKLMEEYPEYIFLSSQPQLYQYMKKNCPEGYEQIKRRIKEGRWEAEGAMWLEADCNLSSGESFIRQIMFGKRFFMDEFAVDSKILWLPDVFGYSAALPQILKKCGVDYFMTTKISWNEINKMPYDTFAWEGIDGTSILSYFVTTSDYCKPHLAGSQPSHFTTYNGEMTPNEMKGTWDRYQQKVLTNEVLSLYGYGDGGGGTTPEMLETRRRLSYGIPGCPKVTVDTASNFFLRLNEKVKGNKRLPKWVGEIYLENHRGTYTSMSRNKKFNRKSELAFGDVEFLSVLSNILAGNEYPQQQINEGWETILLNQFHDILPGSSIKEVYDESKEQYEQVLQSADHMIDGAIDNLCALLKLDTQSAVVFNQLSFDREDIVEIEIPKGMGNIRVLDGNKELPSQITSDDKFVFLAKDVPAKGYKSFTIQEIECESNSIQDFDGVLENKNLSIHFNEQGNMTSIYDKHNNRQILKEGQCAGLQAFYDMSRSAERDNWQIQAYYNEQMWAVDDLRDIRIIENGSVRKVLRIEKRFVNSIIKQDIMIYNHTSRIDFKTFIDWKEKDILLKAAFDVDIHTTQATYEIQYGNVERATYVNTSWDAAKFEVCAHKWADLSEAAYGVSLLNDCKYGYDIKDGLMRLTLVKSTCYPNPDMDKEQQTFTYSLYPHAGEWRKGKTQQAGYMLNCPMHAKIEQPHNGKLLNEFSFIRLNKDNVAAEVIKKSEAGGNIIVRLYEFEGARVDVSAVLGVSIDKIFECDMLENNIVELDKTNQGFNFTIKPYEIKTFKIYGKHALQNNSDQELKNTCNHGG